MLSVDEEGNIPTFFSASMLLFAAILLGIIRAFKQKVSNPYTFHWLSLAFVFLYLAFDEAASIHELLIRPTRELIGAWATGIFYYAWVIPAMPMVIVLAFAYLRFWLHLPIRTRAFVFVAGLLYITGAIGIELFGGRYAERHGIDNVTYSMIVSVEESLEMAGTILFVFALLDYIERSLREVRFQIVTLPKENE